MDHQDYQNNNNNHHLILRSLIKEKKLFFFYFGQSIQEGRLKIEQGLQSHVPLGITGIP